MVRISRFIGLIAFFSLAPCLVTAQVPRGSGHTTQPVGNYADGAILPSGQVITPTAAPGSLAWSHHWSSSHEAAAYLFDQNEIPFFSNTKHEIHA
jgi:hypothetical protein